MQRAETVKRSAGQVRHDCIGKITREIYRDEGNTETEADDVEGNGADVPEMAKFAVNHKFYIFLKYAYLLYFKSLVDEKINTTHDGYFLHLASHLIKTP